MNFETYQEEAARTAIYPPDADVLYPMLGLVSEVGELAGKMKKVIRDGPQSSEPYSDDAMKAELGDVLWYVAALATDCGWSLDEIARNNIQKLKDRQARGVIRGSGDNR